MRREYCCSSYIIDVLYIGLNITEVAHDYNTQLRTYVAVDLGLVNSFDTWHGMSSMYIPYTCISSCTLYRHQKCSQGGEKNSSGWGQE